MMKMATGDGSPLRRVPERGLDWFSVATEPCGGGTPDLLSVLEVLGYVSIYGCRKYVGGASGAPRGRGRALGGGNAPHPCEHLPTDFLRLYRPTYPENIHGEDTSGVPPPQASVATKNLSGACSSTLPEGGSITGGHLHHPGALHDEEGVVHPRGRGYVPVAMCLISQIGRAHV